MFGIGFWELFVIFVLLVIFIKPEEIPKVIRQAGKVIAQIRSFYINITEVFNNIDKMKDFNAKDMADEEDLFESKYMMSYKNNKRVVKKSENTKINKLKRGE